MADQRRIKLYPGHGTPKTVVMRDMPVPNASAVTKIYLRSFHGTAKTIILGDPTIAPPVEGGFPTQYPGLRFFHGSTQSLCLVATADAPAGDRLTIRKGGTDYALYLVDTTDPDASTIRIQTAEGIRAIRLLT